MSKEEIFSDSKYFNNVEFIGFNRDECFFRIRKGVYSFGESYVGARINIRKRIIQHLKRYSKGKYKTNNNLKTYLDDCYKNNKKIQVFYRDPDPFNEMKVAKSLGFDVCNSNEIFYHESYKKQNIPVITIGTVDDYYKDIALRWGCEIANKKINRNYESFHIQLQDSGINILASLMGHETGVTLNGEGIDELMIQKESAL